MDFESLGEHRSHLGFVDENPKDRGVKTGTEK